MAGDFGTTFTPEMIISTYDGANWISPSFVPSDRLELHPAAHVLHYASTCFEGMKAFKHDNGRVAIFRMDQNMIRFAKSSAALHLPEVDCELLKSMTISIVSKYKDMIPEPPGSFYIRPTHIGVEAAIGKAAAPSSMSKKYILVSPVGDYFSTGEKALRILVDDVHLRCAPDHGRVKGGGNYASALKHIVKARQEHNADQVLFSPGDDVQETGAANFIIFDGNDVITKSLDDSFLHGITRDSILHLARVKGMNVIEKNITVQEMLERCSKPGCEAALSGTAAVLASVGTLIYKDREYSVGNGKPGDCVRQLRQSLNDIQWGRVPDDYQWLTFVD